MTDVNTKNRKPLVWVIVAIVLVVIIVGIYFLVRQNGKEDVNQAFKSMFAVETQMRIRNQDDQAKKTLTDFLDQHPNLSPEQKSKIYTELAAISNTAGNTQEAINWQSKSIDNSTNATFIGYYDIAENCYTTKDKECAIKYYKLAEQKLEQDTAKRPMGWQVYQARIKSRLKALGA